MSDQFLGEIRMVGFNFAPIGWAFCDGQILPISQYAALFSLLGTQFGGNGQSNFGLPNFQSSIPMNQGNGAGLTPRSVGEYGGEESLTLLTSEIPAHSHSLQASNATATSTSPSGTLPAIPVTGPRRPNQLYVVPSVSTPRPIPMLANSAQPSGGNLPHNNLQPYLVVNFIIALQGIFPQRS